MTRALWTAMVLLTVLPGPEGSIEHVATVRTDAIPCPDVCRCTLDGRGRMTVVCDRGGMQDPIPVRHLDSGTEVLLINASPETGTPLNSLTIGPIFQGLAHLEELRVTHSNVPAIGKHSFWGLRHLRILSLAHNNISTVVESNFRALISLQELYLHDNVIDSVPSAAFRHLPALRTLSMARNRLSELVPRLFYGLHKLEDLDLSGNQLTELEPEVFRDVRLLKTFLCRECGLTLVNPLLLHLLPDLHSLDLGDNQLTYLDKNSFGDLKHLRELHLDGNELTVITSGVFTGHHLALLNLARNRIIKLDPVAFINVSIVHMDLGYNRLQNLDGGVLTPLIPSLTSLVVSGNPLSVPEIQSTILAPFASLSAELQRREHHPEQQLLQFQLKRFEMADLKSYNRAEPVPLSPDFFATQTQLQVLNISGNRLSQIAPDMLQAVSSLRTLDLSRNALAMLPETLVYVLSRLQFLEELELHGNPWHCQGCAVGPLLRWMETSPAFKHVRSACGTIGPNFTISGSLRPSDFKELHCPYCATPTKMAGVELPRLDPVSLPACHGGPAMLDLSGGNSIAGVLELPTSSSNNPFATTSPLYLGLAGGVITLLLLAVCAGLAVAGRHAASYYTHEEGDKQSKQRSLHPEGTQLRSSSANPAEDLDHLTVMDIKAGLLVEEQRKSLLKNGNGVSAKNKKGSKRVEWKVPSRARSRSRSPTISRGVNCNQGSSRTNGHALYPRSSSHVVTFNVSTGM